MTQPQDSMNSAETGGGAYIGGNVEGRNVVGRDQIDKQVIHLHLNDHSPSDTHGKSDKKWFPKIDLGFYYRNLGCYFRVGILLAIVLFLASIYNFSPKLIKNLSEFYRDGGPSLIQTPFPTFTPTTTPTLTYSAIVEALAQAGIQPDSGFVAARIDEQKIDNTDQDNVFEYKLFDGEYQDFVVGTTFRWGPGATEDECGFLLRRIDIDHYYKLDLGRDGEVQLTATLNGEWRESTWGNGSAIRTSRSISNELMLVAVGNRFSVYINGQYAAQLQDDSLTEAGRVALQAGTYDESDETYCTFTDAWVWELKFDSTPTPIPSPTPTPTF